MVVNTITIHAGMCTGVSANFQKGKVGGIDQAYWYICAGGVCRVAYFTPLPCADAVQTLMSSLLYLVKIKYLGRFLIELEQLHKGAGKGFASEVAGGKCRG